MQAKTLENRVQALQDDLFAAQDEIQAVQEKYEEVCIRRLVKEEY